MKFICWNAQDNPKLRFLRRQHSEAALLRQRSCFNVLTTVGESIEADILVAVQPPQTSPGNVFSPFLGPSQSCKVSIYASRRLNQFCLVNIIDISEDDIWVHSYIYDSVE